MKKLSNKNIPIVGLDPSTVLTYRQEYPHKQELMLPQELLVKLLEHKAIHRIEDISTYYLLSHCTEAATLKTQALQWQQVFTSFGLHLELINLGCCGMAGSYGYVKQNADNSRKMFYENWQQQLPGLVKEPERYLATGFSCRQQVKRFLNIKLKHPLQILLQY